MSEHEESMTYMPDQTKSCEEDIEYVTVEWIKERIEGEVTEEELQAIKKQVNAGIAEREACTIARHKKAIDDLLKKGNAMLYSKQYESAIEAYMQAMGIEEMKRKDATNLGRYCCLASDCWNHMNLVEKALDTMNKAISYDPVQPYYFHRRALIYDKMGMRIEAIADLEMALSIDPGFFASRHKLAELE
ncbi:hypothetical protein M3Y97_01088700 [Aphelenchoides bicaudatus]|nr:hypothetical protein M3Y97_01088700 [Aphelenchoides bicaudatus]